MAQIATRFPDQPTSPLRDALLLAHGEEIVGYANPDGSGLDNWSQRRPRRLAHSLEAEVADLRPSRAEPVRSSQWADLRQLLGDVAKAVGCAVVVLVFAAVALIELLSFAPAVLP
jgi:hypothetical protein